MTTYDCTLTFDNRHDARSFAELFAERFSHGYDLGFERLDKSNDLHIYGMDKEQADWVKNSNGF
jgi:hypothetical protein